LPAACLEPQRVVRIVLRRDGDAHRVSVFADGLEHPLALLAARCGGLGPDCGRGVSYRLARR
jgi:hypothetical protein